jgi:hypothetical protein
MKVPISELRKVEQYLIKARQRIIHSDTSLLENALVDECLHLCADFGHGIQFIKDVLEVVGNGGNSMEEAEHGIEYDLLPKRWEIREN